MGRDAAIGIFDSGVGGLTVLAALRKALGGQDQQTLALVELREHGQPAAAEQDPEVNSLVGIDKMLSAAFLAGDWAEAERLAELARNIRDRIRAALAIETDKGPLTRLMKAFQEALVHNLKPDGFADMYAQTVTYGLFSARATRSGDLAEVSELGDAHPLRAAVTSTRENCLGGKCPDYAACFVMQARREALAADVVVVNHHLFFADVMLRDVFRLIPLAIAVTVLPAPVPRSICTDWKPSCLK